MKAAAVSLCLALSLASAAQSRLDSLQYILPAFSAGAVRYSDGSFSRGLVNISPMDQTVYCLSAAGDTLVAENNSGIMAVSMGGRNFTKWNDSFVELVVSSGEIGVGVVRATSRVNNAKTSAFGTVDRLSSIDTYSHRQNTGSLRTNIIDNPLNYVYVTTPCLCKGGRYFNVTKKAFEKLFPDKKDYIESVWAERRQSVCSLEGAVAFFRELMP